jgi:DNA-binding transcriptional regulator PaaX
MAFGYLQHSVWLSPDSVDALRNAMQAAEVDVGTLSFMEARPCGGESDADLVAGAWDFNQINRGYELYLEVLASQPSRKTSTAWRKWFDVECRAWYRAVVRDPLLPESLLPKGYRGQEAWDRRIASFRKLIPT